jgi:hypothetical protein
MGERAVGNAARRALRFSGCIVVAMWAPPGWAAEPAAPSRLVIIGPADVKLFGQSGYCGSMASYDQADTSGAPIEGGKRVWIRLRHRQDCVGDFSFVPAPGRAYILRAGAPQRACVVDLHRVNPGAAPTRENLEREARRSCLLPWNHEPAASEATPEDRSASADTR